MEKDYISVRTNMDANNKEKKRRRKNIKNACGCDNEHTVGSIDKTHACTIF